MARPVSIQNDVILEAARKVFLEHGYQASTAQVARAAGVSEGSLFKRFKDKAGLFLAAMDAEPSWTAWQENLMQSAGKGDLRRTLEAAGLKLLQRLQVVLPRVMMVHSSGIVVAGHPRGRGGVGLTGPRQTLRVLTAFFRAEQRQGRLAMRNPALHAQIFVGALTHYVVQNLLFGVRTATPAVYVRTVVDMILRATAAAPGQRERPALRGKTDPGRVGSGPCNRTKDT